MSDERMPYDTADIVLETLIHLIPEDIQFHEAVVDIADLAEDWQSERRLMMNNGAEFTVTVRRERAPTLGLHCEQCEVVYQFYDAKVPVEPMIQHLVEKHGYDPDYAEEVEDAYRHLAARRKRVQERSK